jgi:hypothetical protein
VVHLPVAGFHFGIFEIFFGAWKLRHLAYDALGLAAAKDGAWVVGYSKAKRFGFAVTAFRQPSSVQVQHERD